MKRWTLIFLLLSAASVWSEAERVPDFRFEGPRWNWGVVPTGGDVSLTWNSTKWFLGAGYEAFGFGRDAITGQPLEHSAPLETFSFFDASTFVRHSWPWENRSLWVVAGAIGYTNPWGAAAPTTRFPDREGGAFGLAQVGITQDLRHANGHGTLSGTFWEVSAWGGPGFLSTGGTDFYRLAVTSAAFFPLWDLEGPRQLFSGVLSLRANAQWIDGIAPPLVLQELTEVRGYHRKLDTRLRSVVTSELRVRLPTIWGVHDLVPVLLFFTEGGWYQGYSNASSTESSRSGWLSSAGAGLGLSVFGAATPTLTVALPLSDGEFDLWWKINFSLRF